MKPLCARMLAYRAFDGAHLHVKRTQRACGRDHSSASSMCARVCVCVYMAFPSFAELELLASSFGRSYRIKVAFIKRKNYGCTIVAISLYVYI